MKCLSSCSDIHINIRNRSLVIGVDVGSETHYARAFNWRGQEFSKKAFSFGNDLGGYLTFAKWLDAYRQSMDAEKVMLLFAVVSQPRDMSAKVIAAVSLLFCLFL